jgi:hypothetical protein
MSSKTVIAAPGFTYVCGCRPLSRLSSHTAHHQELKNCNCSLWFYIHPWLPATVKVEFPLNLDSGWQPQTYVKPEAAITIFELLMMIGVARNMFSY